MRTIIVHTDFIKANSNHREQRDLYRPESGMSLRSRLLKGNDGSERRTRQQSADVRRVIDRRYHETDDQIDNNDRKYACSDRAFEERRDRAAIPESENQQ